MQDTCMHADHGSSRKRSADLAGCACRLAVAANMTCTMHGSVRAPTAAAPQPLRHHRPQRCCRDEAWHRRTGPGHRPRALAGSPCWLRAAWGPVRDRKCCFFQDLTNNTFLLVSAAMARLTMIVCTCKQPLLPRLFTPLSGWLQPQNRGSQGLEMGKQPARAAGHKNKQGLPDCGLNTGNDKVPWLHNVQCTCVS